jgi:hypothetical protein
MSTTLQHTMAGSAFELTGGTGRTLGQTYTIILTAPAAVDVYVGYTSGVLTSTGLRVPAGGSFSVALGPYERMWAIGASGVITYARVIA